MAEKTAIERVRVTLGDGVERILRYTMWDLKEAREEFGGSITDVETRRKITEENIGRLLWYGLRTDQPELDADQISRLLEPPMMGHVMECFLRSVSASLPDAKNVLGPAAEMMERLEAMLMRAEAMINQAAISTGSVSGPSESENSGSPMKDSGDSPSGNSLLSVSATSNG